MKQQTRILIVDDQLSIRNGLDSFLRLCQGIEVVDKASNGQEAIKLVDTYHPDVVLMDIQMPVMDGLETIRRIKGQYEDVRVVALTMYQSDRTEALRAGADDSLVKGCASKDLLGAIKKNKNDNGRVQSG